MASLTVAVAANVAASASSIAGTRVTGTSRSATVSTAKMTAIRCEAKSDAEVMQRRAVVTAAAASVLALVSGSAMAVVEEEPKKGSKAAKQKYSNICVSNPTASVCHG